MLKSKNAFILFEEEAFHQVLGQNFSEPLLSKEKYVLFCFTKNSVFIKASNIGLNSEVDCCGTVWNK